MDRHAARDFLAARGLPLSLDYLDDLRKRDALPAHKAGRRVVFDPDTLWRKAAEIRGLPADVDPATLPGPHLRDGAAVLDRFDAAALIEKRLGHFESIGSSERTLRRHLSEGEGPESFKIAGRRRWEKRVVSAWCDRVAKALERDDEIDPWSVR